MSTFSGKNTFITQKEIVVTVQKPVADTDGANDTVMTMLMAMPKLADTDAIAITVADTNDANETR